MEEVKKRKTRMYEPWGYQDENHYQGSITILDDDLDTFFTDATYNKDDNKIYFKNRDDENIGELDVSEFVTPDSVVVDARYEDGKIIITFSNGDVVTIDVEELIDETEFADGLQVVSGVVSVLIDSESEPYLTVSEHGLKLSGINSIFSAETILNERIDNEIARSMSAETALNEKIDAEISRATEAEGQLSTSISEEVTRATQAEETLQGNIDAETTRATEAEEALDNKISSLSGSIQSEITRATEAEERLETLISASTADLEAKIDQEILDREIAVTREKERAEEAESDLIGLIEAEEARATARENELEEADVAEGTIYSNGIITLTLKDGSEMALNSAETIEMGAGEF